MKYLFIDTVNCLYANISLNLKNNTQNTFAKERGRTFFKLKMLYLTESSMPLQAKNNNFENYSSQLSTNYLAFYCHKYYSDHYSLFVAVTFH